MAGMLIYEDTYRRVFEEMGGTPGMPGHWTTQRVEWLDRLGFLLTSARGRVTLEPDAVYDVNEPVDIVTDGLVIDGQGATIRLAATNTYDRILRLVGADQGIENVTFILAGKSSGDPMAANVRLDGKRGTIRGCRFATGTQYGVMVTGDNARVIDNHLGGSGILYAWDTSTGVTVTGNTVLDAPSNALTGNGTGGGSLIADNIVTTPERMGIEDAAPGAVIRGNRITGSGDIGISAVAANMMVDGNTITDATDYGIEVAADAVVVRGNCISYTAPPAAGAGIAVTGSHVVGPQGATIAANTVHRAHVGIELTGALPVVAVVGNTITDAEQRAISLEPVRAEAISCVGNAVRFDNPAASPVGFRDGIAIGGCRSVNVTGNVLAYTANSAGDAYDIAIRPTADSSVIVANTVDGGGRSDGRRPSISTNGASPAGLIVANNALVGGAVNSLA